MERKRLFDQKKAKPTFLMPINQPTVEEEQQETILFVEGLLHKIQQQLLQTTEHTDMSFQEKSTTFPSLQTVRKCMMEQLQQDISMGESYLQGKSSSKSSMKKQVESRLNQLQQAKQYMETQLQKEQDFATFVSTRIEQESTNEEESPQQVDMEEISVEGVPSSTNNCSKANGSCSGSCSSQHSIQTYLVIATALVGVSLAVRYFVK